MEEVDVERLKAYAAGKLSARERDIFEQYCRSLGYNPQVLVEILEFEQNQPRATSPYDANAAFEKFKSKLNK